MWYFVWQSYSCRYRIYLKNWASLSVTHLRDFSTDSTDSMIAYGRLADAYSELGKKNEGRELLQKSRQAFPGRWGLTLLNFFLFQAGYLLEKPETKGVGSVQR